jgi:hypothetical protein
MRGEIPRRGADPVARAHLRALQVFGNIGQGKTCGIETRTSPGWNEVPAQFDAYALPV